MRSGLVVNFKIFQKFCVHARESNARGRMGRKVAVDGMSVSFTSHGTGGERTFSKFSNVIL